MELSSQAVEAIFVRLSRCHASGSEKIESYSNLYFYATYIEILGLLSIFAPIIIEY